MNSSDEPVRFHVVPSGGLWKGWRWPCCLLAGTALLAGAACGGLASALRAEGRPPLAAGSMPMETSPSDLGRMMHDIHVLRQIWQLRLTDAQAEALLGLAESLEGERQGLVGPGLKPEAAAVLKKIRQRLLEDAPETEMGPLFEQLGQVLPPPGQGQGEPGAPPNPQEMETRRMDMAWSKAGEAVKLLQADQIMRLLGEGEGGGNLAHQWMGRLFQARENAPMREPVRRDLEWKVGRMLGRGDAEQERAAREEVAGLIERTLSAEEGEAAARPSEVLKQFEKLIQARVHSPFELMQLQAEQRMLEWLMEPRLAELLREKAALRAGAE
ncbi:MAG: hypothetical protein HYU36_07290 [Planctomycetes bacterium]|nr:hypothetical protein [Planctomycetota bacterium]